MFPFFPPIYKNELLYSLFARYHIRSGNRHAKRTYVDLFGEEHIKPYAHIPRKIESVFNKVASIGNYNIHDWINNNTLFLYFTNFAKDCTRKDLLDVIKKGGKKSINIGQSNIFLNTAQNV